MLKRERGKTPFSIGDGLTGRRTGVTVEDTGERDENGMEKIDNIYQESADEDSEEEKPLKGSHAMSDFKVQRDDSDDEQASHVSLPPQTLTRPPKTKIQAIGLNDVTQRATNQLPKQTTKQTTTPARGTTLKAPSSARRLKIVSAVPVSKVVSKPSTSSKASSFDSKPATQSSSTAPKITKVSAIKSIQPVPAQKLPAPQPKQRQPSPDDTVDSLDMSPAPYNNPYVAPPTKFVPKTFSSTKPFTATDSVFKTPARANSLYGDSPADSTPGVPTPAFKPVQFNPGTFQFGGAKDVFDIPEDEPINMGMDIDMGMDMSMDMDVHDESIGYSSPKNEIKGVRPADVFNSPNVPNSRDSRGSLFGSPDVPKPLPKPKAKSKEPKKKPAKERKPSFAEKYKPRDFSKANDDLFKPFKVPSKTVSSKTVTSKPASRVEDDSIEAMSDNDSNAMDFTSIVKHSGPGSFVNGKSSKSKDTKTHKPNTSVDSLDFDLSGTDDIGGGDYDISMGGDDDVATNGGNGSLGEDDSISSTPRHFDRSINYREISTVDDSRMDYEEDSDDDYYDQSYRLEDDGDDDDDDDDDDEYNSAVDETMNHGRGVLPSPPRSLRRHRPKRNVGRPVRYWMGEGIQYKLEKSEAGGFVPVVKSVTRLPDNEEAAERTKRKRRKAYDVDDAIAEADADANENTNDNNGVVTNWQKKKSVEVEVFNYTAEEGDPETHMETVAYSHDGCDYTDPSPEGLSVAQLFGDKKDFTQSGMVRLIGGGRKPERNSRHHLHHFYVLSGIVDVTIGEKVIRIKAGCPFIIPRGTMFALQNASETIEALLFYVRSHDTLLRYEERVAQAEMDGVNETGEGEGVQD
ncbi:hypothetical protein B0I72DRAFT_142748 [Yarrowia lipolytica]|nr:hypothetical protein B0I72DRAFT_142748 [Yarrowia lipolytica]RDW44098.1 hypothetical protein B0I74DRAFT_140937 [Yarrowia lipolytica]RDW50891.1 hypothetical protein B0I75DRAFT_140796 [Yarrowia lipolytica]